MNSFLTIRNISLKFISVIILFYQTGFVIASEEHKPKNIVFSGHSLTDAAIPTFLKIAEQNKIKLNSVYQTIPGSPIRIRTRGEAKSLNDWSGYGWGLPKGIDLINEFREPSQLPKGQKYDTLVITERHDILGTLQWEGTIELLRHFHDRLLEGNTDGQTILYQSWLDIKKDNPSPWIQYEKDSLTTWECISSKANQSLASQKLSPSISTIGAGWALAHLVEKALSGEITGLKGSPKEVLNTIFSDNVHLNPVGEFFIGSFVYSELFNAKPINKSFPSRIKKDTGEYLSNLAWQLSQQYRATRKNNNNLSMEMCREHIANNICQPYWTDIFSRPDQINSCKSFFGGNNKENPFQDNVSNLKIWPSPE